MAKLNWVALGALALSGCGAGGDGKVKPKPGMWEWTSRNEILEVTGVPEELAQKLRQAQPSQPARQECLTPEQANKDITELASAEAAGCRFSKVVQTGGDFSAVVDCAAGERKAHGMLKGTIAPEKITMNSDMNMTVLTPQGATATLHIRVRQDSKRVGECTAK